MGQHYSFPLKTTLIQIAFKKLRPGTSLVVQWLRIRLPIQGTQVQSLVGELRCPRATGQLSLHAATTEHADHN